LEKIDPVPYNAPLERCHPRLYLSFTGSGLRPLAVPAPDARSTQKRQPSARHRPKRTFHQRHSIMSKDKNRGNKEIKKPKKEAPKVLATANSNAGKDNTTIAGKKIK
jgi:hypothetical protein